MKHWTAIQLISYAAILFLLSTFIMDSVSTHIGLKLGATEQNPLATKIIDKWHDWGLYAMQLISIALLGLLYIIIVVVLVHRNENVVRLMVVLVLILAVMKAMVVTQNLIVALIHLAG